MFHDAVLLYTQYIQVVNFSNINKGLVHVIIMYKTLEGQSVKLEAVCAIDETYIHNLDFIGKLCRGQPKRPKVIVLVPFHH